MTVHQNCLIQPLPVCSRSATEHIGKVQSVAGCPPWPVHKEDVTLQVLRTIAFFIQVQEGNLKLSFFDRMYWFALQGWEENMHFICFDSWPSELHLSAVLAQQPLAEEEQGWVALFLLIGNDARLWMSAFPLALWWHLKIWQLWISSAIYRLDCTWLTDRQGAKGFFFSFT